MKNVGLSAAENKLILMTWKYSELNGTVSEHWLNTIQQRLCGTCEIFKNVMIIKNKVPEKIVILKFQI